MPESGTARVCLVAEELSFDKGAGGIGGAFHELALLLRRAGHAVDLIHLPVGPATQPAKDLTDYYDGHGIRVLDAGLDRFVWPPFTYEKRSYALFRYLVGLPEAYDTIHFHDFKGLGFFSLLAKGQRLAFAATKLVIQVHGPTRWALEANDHPFTHEDQLKIDYMERESIARADLLVSPSRYMLRWLKQNGWMTPPAERIQVIQNVCSHLQTMIGPVRRQAATGPCNEIVFFGRHEERKGIATFCDALDLVQNELADANVAVTFLGRFGVVNGQASALYLADRARGWCFPLRLKPDFDRLAATRYLTDNDRSVVAVPSRIENLPYTVMEAAMVAKPVITSAAGGAGELLDPALTAALTCEIGREALAAKLLEAVQHGLPAARLAVSPETTERLWLAVHALSPCAVVTRPGNGAGRKKSVASRPKVVAAITHFERPAKLFDAVMSLVGQSYAELEIVVVDDGSRSPETLLLLARLAPLFDKLQVRLLRQENRYLGAARNHAVACTDSDYVLFLDDDDIAFPNLVQTLVTAAEASGADIVNCLNLYMAEARRGEAHPFPDLFVQKASYVPTGGPLSLAPLDNCFGGATSLIRRRAFALIGGYTETYGVGHEDYELYLRALQAGLKIEICPLPLYLYEVDRPGMATKTSRLRNWNRIAGAVDMTRQSAAWSDLASLNAGRRAHEHVENYARYRIASSPQSELLTRLEATPIDTMDYALLLTQYAAEIGATTWSTAARDLAIARQASGGLATTILMPPLGGQAAPEISTHTETDALMLCALIDLSFGRLDAAVTTFSLTLERYPGPLWAGQIRWLKALVDYAELPQAMAARALGLLKRKSSSLAELTSLLPVMFRLALCARDLSAAIAIIDRAVIVDEQTYLANDPSVAELISHGTFSSPLDHFGRAGEASAKASFGLLQEIKAALRTQLGVEVPITSLRQYVLSLARGRTVEIDVRPLATNAGDARSQVRGNGASQPVVQPFTHPLAAGT